jgi:hypothetical protein
MPEPPPVDWTNPCERFAALSKAYYSLVSGALEIEIRTRTLDAEEMVRFSRADLNTLRNEVRVAETACCELIGLPNPNRRFAMPLTYRSRKTPATYDPTDPRG